MSQCYIVITYYKYTQNTRRATFFAGDVGKMVKSYGKQSGYLAH